MLGDDLLSHGVNATLASALNGFTAKFEMGLGGSRSLMSPNNLVAARVFLVRVDLQIHCV